MEHREEVVVSGALRVRGVLSPLPCVHTPVPVPISPPVVLFSQENMMLDGVESRPWLMLARSRRERLEGELESPCDFGVRVSGRGPRC